MSEKQKESLTRLAETVSQLDKEDFNYMACGVPSVATAKGEETLFYDTAYHTNADSDEVVEFDEDTWLWMHTLYGRIVYAFDDLAARPMDFGTRFEAFKDTIDKDTITDKDLSAKADEVVKAAKPVTEKINTLNSDYAVAVADGDMKKADKLRAEAIELNSRLHAAYKQVQDEFLYLDGEMSVIFPHESRQANVQNLQGAIDALNDSDAEGANDFLTGINNGWYAMYFDKETVDYFNNNWTEGLEGTWAEGNIDPMDCYVDDIVRTLMTKADSGDTDFSAEIAQLETLKAEQQDKLNAVVEKEKSGMDAVIATLKALI